MTSSPETNYPKLYSNLLLCLNNTSASSPAAPQVRPSATAPFPGRRRSAWTAQSSGNLDALPSFPRSNVKCICANDWAGVAERMLSSSQKPWKTEDLMEDSRLACAAEPGLGVS